MNTEQYSSSDLWQSAYILCESDAELVDFQVNHNGRTTVSFCLRGKNLSKLAKDYCNNQALANVTELRAKINLLRDIIFQSTKTRSN